MNDEHQPDHPPNLLDLITSATEDYNLVMVPLLSTVIAEDMPDICGNCDYLDCGRWPGI